MKILKKLYLQLLLIGLLINGRKYILKHRNIITS
ncbi:unnamed protein product [Nezara viridula]|uniref:Uncharacterized protein n=1 Tax=Nezara viridula TaxID=85310 RepID=A0A9P0HH92_NEZVI|nr:unnamed protein product [Nezara viridula]